MLEVDDSRVYRRTHNPSRLAWYEARLKKLGFRKKFLDF